MILQICVACVSRARRGWSDKLLMTDCGDLENLSASEIYVMDSNIKKSNKKERFRFLVRTGLSNSSIFLDFIVTKGPLEETSGMMKKKKWDRDPSLLEIFKIQNQCQT